MKDHNLIKILRNSGKIIEGIKNSIFTSEHVEEVAKERLEICKVCVRYDTVGTSCAMPGTQPCCSLCGCSMHLKLRSLSSSCDDLKWKAVLTQEEEDTLTEHLKTK